MENEEIMENEKEEKKKKKWLLLFILFLLISVVLSTVVYFDMIKDFYPNDDGAIDVVGPDDSNDKEDEFVAQPGFQVSDDKGVWTKTTTIEIFKISYENGEKKITMMSDNGDKIIAPGSENSYTFKLKNTGNVAMEYDLNVDAYITPSDLTIPVQSRINRFDGKWISGSKTSWSDVNTLDKAKDNYILGPGRFTKYTLDWQWLFESGDDEFDTYLGNLAVDNDITLTIEIKTVATVNENPSYIGGILVPTGDNAQPYLYTALGGTALIIFFILLYKKEDKKDDEE